MRNHEVAALINVGCGEDLTIRELVEVIRRVVGYKGETMWDRTKPDGTPRKLLDVSRPTALGWKARIGLEEGILHAHEDHICRG